MATTSTRKPKTYKPSHRRWDRDFPWVKPEDREPAKALLPWPDGARCMSYDGRGHWTDHGPAKASDAGSVAWPVDWAPPEPLVLDPGCLRCGEPVDDEGRDETCSACLRELTHKGEAPAELVISEADYQALKDEVAADDFKRREAMAQKWNPPRDEYEHSTAWNDKTTICRNPFAAVQP